MANTICDPCCSFKLYCVFFRGSIKERTQTSTEMGISCQRNEHWAATNHLSGRGLVQPIKELSSVAGRYAGRGCALIRQLANTIKANFEPIKSMLAYEFGERSKPVACLLCT